MGAPKRARTAPTVKDAEPVEARGPPAATHASPEVSDAVAKAAAHPEAEQAPAAATAAPAAEPSDGFGAAPHSAVEQGAVAEPAEAPAVGDGDTAAPDTAAPPEAVDVPQTARAKAGPGEGARKRSRKPAGPHGKRPLNSYMIFFQEKRCDPAFAELRVTDTAREIAAAWRSLGTDERQVYKERASVLKTEYDARVAVQE